MVDGYWNDRRYKKEWKVIEKKRRRDDSPRFHLYEKCLFFFWFYHDDYDSLEGCKRAAMSYEKFLEREEYEKEVWRSHYQKH